MLHYQRLRLIAVLFALFSMLSMQVAVAGYACPVENKVPGATAMSHAAMPCAGDMSHVDIQQPSLCQAHCQAEKSTDKLPSPLLPGAMSIGFSYAVHQARVVERSRFDPSPSYYRATAPPISVRNCCFRI